MPFLDQDGNFTFDSATALALGTNDELRFAGVIDGRNDIDLYNIGNLAAGDRLLVDVRRADGNLDAVVSVFNAAQDLEAFNDDRADDPAADASHLNPLLDFVIRGGQGPFYIGIAALDGSNTSGRYEVTVRITRNGAPAAPVPQIVFLDWDGGQGIVVPNVGTFDLTPFDAADLGPYDGLTGRMKDAIQQQVQDRFQQFNLVLLNSDDHPEPELPHSIIYFGGNNRSAFAISEHIDTANVDPSDRSIVFTRAYRDAFGATPSFDEMCVAVGNTVAHEIGHLLGLVHTADCDELMDTTCGNNRILLDQKFGRAPLDASVFPIGFQNAADVLGWLLGLRPN